MKTTPQTALLGRLPEAFQIHEAFSKSDRPATEIRDLDGKTLFTLTTGEPRTLKSLMQAELIVKVDVLSRAGAGLDSTTVWKNCNKKTC